MALAGHVPYQLDQSPAAGNIIEYLRTENAVLKERIGKKRILLNDDQRRRLAVKGKILGRKALEQFGTLFTPDTILRWHRQLVAQKWDYSDRKKKNQGRPRIRQVMLTILLAGVVAELILLPALLVGPLGRAFELKGKVKEADCTT